MVERLRIPTEMDQQLSGCYDELLGRLREALEATAFSNRFLLPPRRLPQIAKAEADAFGDFLKTGDIDKIREQGAKRTEEGLGEQAMLRLGTTLRQFCRDYLADEALQAADVYADALLDGFMEGREAVVLREQEQIRGALQRVISRYALQLVTATEVSRAASSILDPTELLPEVVNLIRDRFNFYYVGLFLLDESGEYAVLRAGTGAAGRQMLEMGHKLEVGGPSMIGWCTARSKARIALDVGREAVRFENPLLPETRSEMALPLLSRGEVIGAMTIQSARSAAFSEEDITALQTMADQLANAIENARLFEEAQQEITERRRAEEALQQREAVLGAIALAAEKFLRPSDWEQDIQAILTYLGKAADVSRAIIWEASTSDDGKYLISGRYEWIAPEAKVAALVGLQNVPAFRRWRDLLPRGEIITGHIRDFSAEEQEFFVPRGIKSILVVPILVNNAWWGFMGFDQGGTEREWTEAEIDALKTAASILGGAIERNRAEEALAEERNLLRTIIDNLPDYIYVKDTESRYFVSNTAHVRFLGATTLDEVVGKSVFELFPQELAAQYYADDQEVIQAGQPLLRREERSVDQAGNPVWLLTTKVPLQDSDGEIVGLVGIARDITERKEAEEALRVSEERFALATQGANDGIWDWDIQDNSLYWSPRLKELLGYADDELEVDFDTFESYLHPDDRERVGAALEAHLKDRVTYDVEERLRTKPGEYRWFRARGQALWDEAGNSIRMTGSVTDITERKQAEAEREQLLTALEYRSAQLQTAAEVSRAGGSILDPNELIQQVVDLVGKRFDLYYAGLFLVDETGKWNGESGRWAVLRAGTGEAGRQMMAQGHKLEVGGESMIGWCVANKQARIALDVGEEAVRFDNPLLPETRSETALPLVSRGQVIGAMTIQSTQPAAFSEEDITVLQTMADQLANAIENARLFEQTQQASSLLGLRVKELACLNDIGQKMEETPPVPEFLQWVAARIPLAMQYREVCLAAVEFEGQVYGAVEAVSLPCQMVQALRIGGKVVGRVYISYTEEHDFLDEESALLGDIVRRVSGYIESRRLFEETQQRVGELASLNELSASIGAEMRVEELVEQVLTQLAELMEVDASYFALYDEEDEEIAFVLEFVQGKFQMSDQPRRKLGKGRTAHIIRSHQPLLLRGNIREAYQRLGIESSDERARAFIGAPMILADRVIGVLAVQSYEHDDAYDEYHLELLTTVAGQVAVALERTRLLEQTRAALAETEALYTGSDRVIRATTMDDVLQGLIHSTTLQRLDRVSIVFFNRPWEDEMPEEVTVVAAWERSGEESRAPVGTRYALDQFPAIEAVTRDAPAIFRDITTDERVYETMRTLLLDRLGMRSLVLWPLVAGGQWIGFVNGQAATALEMDEDEIRQITSLTDQAATVIQNLRLFEQAQARAERERIIREISDQMQRATDMEALMRITTEELNRALGASRAYVRLGTEAEIGASLKAGPGSEQSRTLG
jgi:PAS domain S-box-containing protein